MPKANILVAASFVHDIKKYLDLFADVNPQIDRPHNHIQFADPHRDIISVSVFRPAPTATTANADALAELLAGIQPGRAVQSYVVFAAELDVVQRFADLRALLLLERLRLVFTNGAPEAVRYSVNLVEKAARYGVYGARTAGAGND